MHALKLFFVVSCMLTIANSEVALVIGGFGASDSVQVITKDATCLGLSANPVIPKAPDGRVGWVGQVSTSCPASTNRTRMKCRARDNAIPTPLFS